MEELTDEVFEALCETYRGLTVEDVEAAILASRHAERVPNSRLLAEYIVGCCAA